MLRIGHGFDSHAYINDPDRPLVLGGVTIEAMFALDGHSDSDVVIHACIDSLLGPTGLGDIGTLFPDINPAYRNADSLELLRHTVNVLKKDGWDTVNIDCSVIARLPKIQPYRELMESKISEVVQAPVTVKGKSTEGLDNVKGIACFAVSLLSKSDG